MNIWQDSNNAPGKGLLEELKNQKEPTFENLLDGEMLKKELNDIFIDMVMFGESTTKQYPLTPKESYERNSKGSVQPPCKGRD